MKQISNGAMWTLGSVLIIALLAYVLSKFEGAPQLTTESLSTQAQGVKTASCGCGCGGLA